MTEDVLQSSTLSDAYFDRNQVVMLLALIAKDLGMNVGVRIDPDDSEWPIVTVDLPIMAYGGGGQVSWHIPSDELIIELPDYDGEWDGHDLYEKRRRIDDYLKVIGRE